jgi:hypothetical protein
LSLLQLPTRSKPNLIRQRLADGFELASEQPSQLTFTKAAGNKTDIAGKVLLGSGTNIKTVLQFTFAQSGESVTVFGSAWAAILNRAGIEETSHARATKESKAYMQKYLETLKNTIEKH